MMHKDKTHYYDGKIFEFLFDPSMKEIRKVIIQQIEPGSRVIDIACGTGALVLDLSQHCESVIGIELSSQMVAHAKKRSSGIKNVTFRHQDATDLPNINDQEYDYAVISMTLHEMPSEIREKVLEEAKRIAKKLIIVDFMTPLPFNLIGLRSYLIELLAGSDHFKNYRNFQKENGLDGLFRRFRLSTLYETTRKKGSIRIMLLR